MNAFTQHCALVPLAGIIPPKAKPTGLAAELWDIGVTVMRSTADEAKRQHALDVVAEQLTEGRAWPRTPNPHCD